MRRPFGESGGFGESGSTGNDYEHQNYSSDSDYSSDYDYSSEYPEFTQPTLQKHKLKLAYVQAEGAVDARARDVARDEMTEEKGKAGFFKRVWKHNWFKDYYERKKEEEVRQRIHNTSNLYIHRDGANKHAHDVSMANITDRFLSEHEAEMVHTAAGESKKSLEEVMGNAEAAQAVKQEVKELVLAYVGGSIITKEEFERQHNARLAGIRGLPREMLAQGAEYASNVYEAAHQLKSNLRHGEALQNLELDLDISIGKAKAGARTEPERERIDRIIEKANEWRSKSRIASAMINEATLGLAVAGTYAALKKLGIGALRSKAAAWISFGAGALVGGAVAAAQENKRIKIDRAQQARESAIGMTFEGKRRQELEGSMYEMVSARTMLDQLAQRQAELEGNPSVENFNNMMAALTEVNARIRLSDSRNIDLVKYSDLTTLEAERNELDKARAQARVFLRTFAQNAGSAILPRGTSFDQYYNDFLTGRENNILQGDIQAKDEAFRKMKNKRVRNAFLKTAAMGIALGTVWQQLYAWGKDLTGYGGGRNNTLIEHGFKYLFGEKNYSGAMQDQQLNLFGSSDHAVNIPQGWKIEPDGSSYKLIDAKGNLLANGLNFENSGKLDQQSIDLLKNQGFGYAESALQGERTINATDYFNKYLGQHKRIDWHDEPGKKYSSFFNKLIEFEGKQQMLYIKEDANGVYVDVQAVLKNLTKNADGLLDKFGRNPDGSFDSKLQHLVNEIKNWKTNGTLGNHLRIAIIPTDDANRQGLSMLIDGASDGKIRFPPEITQLFKQAGPQSLKDGKLPFKFGELFLDAPDGRHVLSTVQGHDAKGIIKETFDNIKPVITPPGKDYDVPFAIPLHDRKPLEKAKRGEIPPPIPAYLRNSPRVEPQPGDDYGDDYGMGYQAAAGYMDNVGRIQKADERLLVNGLTKEQETKRINERRSKTLKENPKAKLDAFKEITDYFRKFNPQEIAMVQRYSAMQGEMSNECKISVGIPVAGHQEGDNIYRTLESYTHQKLRSSEFELVLFVNHPEKEKGTGKKLSAKKTVEEIERFKEDYPDMNVKVIYQMFPGENVQIGRVRKILNDTILYRNLKRGTSADHLIVSNDADNVGIAPEYLSNFVEKFKKNPKVDAYLGQLDWDPVAYAENPAIYVGTRLYEFLRTQSRRNNPKYFGTSGANFAFRASIYAAVGGYDSALSKGEDMNFGKAIRLARGAFDKRYSGELPIQYAGARVSRVYTNSRRAIHAWEEYGRPVNNMWGGEFTAQDEARILKLSGEVVNYNDPAFLKDLKKELEAMITRTMDVKLTNSKRLKADEPKYRRMIENLGIRYELDNRGTIVITDMSRLIDRLKEYQEYAVHQRDMKAGVPGAGDKFKEVRDRQATEREKKEKQRLKEYERKTKKLKKELAKFYSKDTLSFTHKNDLLQAEVVNNSRKKEVVGDYTYAADKPLKEQESAGGVYPGIDKNGKVVVIKVVPKKFMEQAAKDYGALVGSQDVEMYLAEKGFNNEHVLMPLHREEKNGLVYRVYEAGNESLADYIRREGKLPAKQAISIMLRTGEGVRSLHENNVAHSDVAHLNVILMDKDVKIGDLESGGIDKKGNGRFGRRYSRGSPFISPPEMYSSTALTPDEFRRRATPRYDASTDVYEAGVVLYRMLTGEYPKKDGNPYEIKDVAERRVKFRKVHEKTKVIFPSGFPDPVKSVVRKALEPLPQNRYRTMADFELALLRAYEQL